MLGLFVRIVTIKAVTTTVIFSLLVTCSGVMLTREVYSRRDPDERVVDGPRVAAIVPVYRDADVIQKSVTSLLASNYRTLEIVLVVEPGDEDTLGFLKEHEHPAVTS